MLPNEDLGAKVKFSAAEADVSTATLTHRTRSILDVEWIEGFSRGRDALSTGGFTGVFEENRPLFSNKFKARNYVQVQDTKY